MAWEQIGNIRGPAGPDGATGATGATGAAGVVVLTADAYDLIAPGELGIVYVIQRADL